jgi:hypothetical protein
MFAQFDLELGRMGLNLTMINNTASSPSGTGF